MTEYQNLIIEQEDSLLIVTINRPKSLNALNKQTMRELDTFFSQDAPNRQHSGVILIGSGEKAFVAGADIKEFQGIDAEGGKNMSAYGHKVFAQVEQHPKPVIAVVNGFALGGGCELAMSCHLRIAEEHARFGQPEIDLGIIPGYGGTQRLIQYLGKGRAAEMLLTGNMINAEQALQYGLVNKVVSKGEGMEAAKKMQAKIATKGPIAIAKTIECINAFFNHATDGFNKEVEAFGHTTGTEDFIEGASAFVEKRKANFKGK